MHRMTWDDRLATSHAGMARDHRKLVDLVNRLADVMAEGKGKFACCAVLDELCRHTQAHFAMEERLMDAHHYPLAGEHKAEHASLVKQLAKHKCSVEAGPEEVSVSLLHFLDFWLTHHILTSDQELADYVTAAGGGQ